jgi:hypothetical protein
VKVSKCSGGDGTAELDRSILEVKIRGCDWEMHLDIQRGVLHASVDNIPVRILLISNDQVPAHMKKKYLT